MTGISTTGLNNPIVKTEASPDDPLGWRAPIRASRIKFDEQQKKTYLEALEKTGVRASAALAAGVHRNTVNNHIKTDPDFADAIDEAILRRRARFVDTIEEEALVGHYETITKEDGTVVKRKVLESGLRAMLLKKYDPEGHNPKTEIDMNLNAGGGVLIVPVSLSKEEWIALYAPKDEPPALETFEDVE